MLVFLPIFLVLESFAKNQQKYGQKCAYYERKFETRDNQIKHCKIE